MTESIDHNDPKYPEAAATILNRHDAGRPEAEITSAVRDFLILTGLAKSEEIKEENPPAGQSRSAVDLTALDTFIEMKRRIGDGIKPNPQWIEPIGTAIWPLHKARGRGVRMGILTDGKHWGAELAWRRARQDGPSLRLYPGRRGRLAPST